MTGTKDEEIKNKYLTEIKELPPETDESEVLPKKPVLKPAVEKAKVVTAVALAKNDREIDEDLEEKISTSKFPMSAKDIILGVINLVSIGVLIFMLTRFPEKAGELANLKKEKILNGSNVAYEFSDIKDAKVVSDKLEALFLDEPGIVDFVNEVEKTKSEGSTIQGVTFANQKAVKDKTGNFGIPIAIELKGTWEVVGRDLENIDKLPFLFRPAKVEIEKSKLEGEENLLIFKYGIFLYVNEKEVTQ